MPYLAAGRIERDNVRADLAQEMLAFLVMYSFSRWGLALPVREYCSGRSSKRLIICLENGNLLSPTIFRQM